MSEIYPRQHSAEHILTAVVGQLFCGKIIGSRFKTNRVRCDYEIHGDTALPEIIQQIEARANQIINQHHPVAFSEVSVSEAKHLCSLHRVPSGQERISLAYIGNDVVTPCHGIHVQNTAEIGTLQIRTFNQISPGVVRLTFSLA